mmetsp:Transcript_48988/g.91703  ORF Transcript_48988/g.91703 Transcript_48988/m.91703 type:complete len:836 (+) Transcript_48988:194-2701(+)
MLSWIWALLVTALLLPLDYATPKGYSLHDPNAAHGDIAIELANNGNMDRAVASFHAACRFSRGAPGCANLGVALMRTRDFGKSYNAFQEALRRDSSSSDAKDNLKVLYDFAKQAGMDKKALVAEAKKNPLNFKAAYDGTPAPKYDGAQAPPSKDEMKKSGGGKGKKKERDFDYSAHQGASDMDGNGGYARRLSSPEEIVNRGRELIHRGEKKMGRAFFNLALLLDPWLMDVKSIAQAFDGEQMEYWNGNVFLGHDKTRLEAHIKAILGGGDSTEALGREMLIYVWRNLQLLDRDCCGIINMIIWLTQFRSTNGHNYVMPFVQLDPEVEDAVNEKNKNIVEQYRRYWKENGEQPMPSPPIKYKNRKWDWSRMKIMLPADRLPVGWIDLMQAVLNYRAKDAEAARVCVRAALRANPDLWQVTDEFMPELIYTAVPAPLVRAPGTERKYVIQYNPSVGLGNTAAAMVSAHALAKLTGRTFLLYWNGHAMQRHAFRFKEKPGVQLVLSDGAEEAGVYPTSTKSLYMFNMGHSGEMTEELELFACSDLHQLEKYQTITVSTNLYFAAFLASNPKLNRETVGVFPEQLADLVEPGPRAIKRASAFASKSGWRLDAPVLAIHVRSRERGEDNDDWPTRESPEAKTIEKLVRCVQAAADAELSGEKSFDVFVAATTEKAQIAVGDAVKKRVKGVRKILTLPNIERNRNTGTGVIDAMAEALLISVSDVFVRLVIGAAGYSTFAHLSNALRSQNSWAVAASLPPARKGSERYAPNYVVSDMCGPGSCFKVTNHDMRSVDISWHGPRLGQRSCGDVFSRMGMNTMNGGVLGRCGYLEAVKFKDEL